MKAINIFCKTITRNILAIKLNTSMAQKSNSSLWAQLPPIQKYVAIIASENNEYGLSLDLGSKSDFSLMSSVSFFKSFVAIPLYVDSLILILSGFQSNTNLY